MPSFCGHKSNEGRFCLDKISTPPFTMPKSPNYWGKGGKTSWPTRTDNLLLWRPKGWGKNFLSVLFHTIPYYSVLFRNIPYYSVLLCIIPNYSVLFRKLFFFSLIFQVGSHEATSRLQVPTKIKKVETWVIPMLGDKFTSGQEAAVDQIRGRFWCWGHYSQFGFYQIYSRLFFQ